MIVRAIAVLLSLALSGCGSSSALSFPAYAGTIPPPAESLALFDYLSQSLPPELQTQMRSDRVQVLAQYPPGVNTLSTAQYGTRMLEGRVDLGDVFDARVPANALAFQTWAVQQGLVASEKPADHVSIYSEAAAKFVVHYQYDAVLFFPDEFHPIFTQPTDTWLFLREDPPASGPPTNFNSRRMSQRQVTLGGGVSMAPSPLTGLFYFYFPTGDQPYAPYRFLEGPVVSTIDGPYTPIVGDAQALQRRQEAGHVSTPVSGLTSVAVGAWMSESGAAQALQNGMLVREDPVIYTWSDDGLYLLALESAFWALPPGASPSINGGTVPP